MLSCQQMNDDRYLQQSIVIKFLAKLEKNGSEIYEMLKEAVYRACVFFWTK
jgi:hypothetical protein